MLASKNLPKTSFIIFMLVIMSSLGPMSMDIYLPSLTIIMDYFSTSYDEVQLTLSLFLLGMGFFQLVFGPLSDKYGRKPTLYGGLFIYCTATLICAFSSSIEMLNTARFIQGVGACGTAVASFAIARDLFEGKQGAKVMASVSSAIGLIPVLAPMLGTYLQLWFGWRSNFLFLLGVSSVIFLFTYFKLKETNASPPVPLKSIFKNYRLLLSHSSYQIFSLCAVFCFGALIAYASNAPFYFIALGGASIQYFSFLFGLNALAFISGSFMTSRLINAFRLETLVIIGGVLMIMGGVLQMILLSFFPYSVLSVMVSMLISSFGIAMVLPTSAAGSLASFPHIAGSASALLGFLRLTGGSIIGAAVGLMEADHTLALSIALVLSGIGIVLAISWLQRSDSDTEMEALSQGEAA